MSLRTVLAVLRDGRKMTADASLVMLDCLERRGLVALPDSPQVRAIFGADRASVRGARNAST
jgi:hypothetical protein